MDKFIYSPISIHRSQLGPIWFSTDAFDTLDHDDAHAALQLHASGDWGECKEESQQKNEVAFVKISSFHRDRNGKPFWIITEWDRSSTTILLPEDY